MSNGKGSRDRTTDIKTYRENYDKIFSSSRKKRTISTKIESNNKGKKYGK